MGDVFISYASADRDQISKLVGALRAEGLDVWWDRDVPPGAEWEPTLAAALESAKCVVVCWSREASASENVRAEARPARKNGKLIQVFLESCEPPPFFGERQGVDLSAWQGDRASERFQFLVRGARDVVAGRKPKLGLGYQRKERGGGGAIIAVATAAILIAAAVGVMWIPEVRKLVFPPPALVWTISPGTNIDLRPGLPPDAAPVDRITSQMLILLQPTFAAEGGVAGEGVVSVVNLTLRVPGAPPHRFKSLWFTNDSPDKGYIEKEGNFQPLRLKEGVGGREMLFQSEVLYYWSDFMAEVGSAAQSGAKTFDVDVSATVMSDNKRQELTSVCTLPLASINQQLSLESNAFRSIIGTCSSAAAH